LLPTERSNHVRVSVEIVRVIEGENFGPAVEGHDFRVKAITSEHCFMYLEPGPAVLVVRNRSEDQIDVGVEGGCGWE
jgi:hypothetical protein